MSFHYLCSNPALLFSFHSSPFGITCDLQDGWKKNVIYCDTEDIIPEIFEGSGHQCLMGQDIEMKAVKVTKNTTLGMSDATQNTSRKTKKKKQYDVREALNEAEPEGQFLELLDSNTQHQHQPNAEFLF